MPAVSAAALGLVIFFFIFDETFGATNPFSDGVPFQIKWVETGPKKDYFEEMTMKTIDNEEFVCSIPDPDRSANQEDGEARLGGELELLKPLFGQKSCSYRIENYWTYELCHGKYLRQFHEEKMGRGVMKVTEYYLGYFHIDKYKDSSFPSSTDLDPPNADTTATLANNDGTTSATTGSSSSSSPRHNKPPVRRIDAQDLPYFSMNMVDGTLCDLSGDLRRARIIYVCYNDAIGEIYEFLETSTCEYEIVVLTSYLCSHPLYRPGSKPVNTISCYSEGNHPPVPKSFIRSQLENLKEGGPSLLEAKSEISDILDTVAERGASIRDDVDQKLLVDFLEGNYCFRGGTGWWQYELCYNKHARQFHVPSGDGDEPSSEIYLGYWDQSKHLSWLQLESNKHRRPAPVSKRKHFWLYFSGGDVCDLTGERRYTLVKLKCVRNSSQPHAVSIYLVEPEPCYYHLVIESLILCPVVEAADNNGLVDVEKLLS